MRSTSETEIISASPSETRRLAEKLAASVEPGDVVSLTGDLGAGKTLFTQGLASGLGVEGPVTSPTFTIIKQYEGRLPLYHFDVYRLAGVEELETLGYEDYFYGNGVTVIEWGDKIGSVLPQDHLTIEFHRLAESQDKRQIIIRASGPRSDKLKRVLTERK